MKWNKIMHSKLHLHENCRTTNTCGRLCATQIMCDTGCVCTTQIMCGRLIMYDRLCATQIMTSSWTDSPRILTSLTRSACCFVIPPATSTAPAMTPLARHDATAAVQTRTGVCAPVLDTMMSCCGVQCLPQCSTHEPVPPDQLSAVALPERGAAKQPV
jgi:hypothetical protein